jgi:hypothetical protein
MNSNNLIQPNRVVPKRTLTILGALKNLGEEVVSKGSVLGIEVIEVFGKEVIKLMSEGIEDIIEFTLPGLEDKDISEITGEARRKLEVVIKTIQAINADAELKQDIKTILKQVSSAAGDMLVTIIDDMEAPVETAITKIQSSTEKIIVRFMKGVVRTTWDTFLTALDPIPIVGEIGGLLNAANSVLHTAVNIIPPAIDNAGHVLELGNQAIHSVLDVGSNQIKTINNVRAKTNSVREKIRSIQGRVAQSIQGVTSGISSMGNETPSSFKNVKQARKLPVKGPVQGPVQGPVRGPVRGPKRGGGNVKTRNKTRSKYKSRRRRTRRLF